VPTSHPYSDIFNRLLEGKISPEEAAALIEWLALDQQDPEAKTLVLAQLERAVAGEQVSSELMSRMEARLPAILAGQEKASPIRRIPWLRYSSVAAVLLLVGAGIYLVARHPQQEKPAVVQVPVKNDVAPGKQGAILTLADGRTVVLDSLGNGVVATQGGAKVLLNNGRLAYNTESAGATEVAYNTVTTPKGRQFQVSLPDGTKVWLNAASSLRYPTVFAGPERKVEVTGEAYFEVSPQLSKDGDRMPFLVKINEQTEVQVLGTHFNINAYKDEATINTTLLEGSVRIVNGGEKAVLRPGQQAQTGESARIKIVADANVEKVMAWKNGVFDFQDATLEEVMRQLQRWYDIDVVYEKGVPKLEFIGKMGRDLSLAEVLGGLQLSKVHFRLEAGRRLVVMP
jgi:transmembrane sensor